MITLECGVWSFGLLNNGNNINDTDMVCKELHFSDGTRIFYEEKNGFLQRYIEYSYTTQEIRDMKEKPFMKSHIESNVRKYNAGKYYYLKVLHSIVLGLEDNQRQQLYSELKALCDRVGTEYDSNIINKDFLDTFGKYWRTNEVKCAAFFTTIYLAMLDLEENKAQYPKSLGKNMVMSSCAAIIIWGKDPQEAATMFEKKKESKSNNYCEDYEPGDDSRYEKYNGYNGYDDDTIDIGFDGFPEAIWNVD